MRKFNFILILFLSLFFLLIIKERRVFLNNAVYAQSDGTCQIGGVYSNTTLTLGVDDLENVRIANHSTVCQFVDFISGSGFNFFEIDNNTLNFSSKIGEPNDDDFKNYFECNNGTWIKRQGMSYCRNNNDIPTVIYNYSLQESAPPLSLNVTQETSSTDTSTSIPNSSYSSTEKDIYGLTCGVPNEIATSDDNSDRCCNTPKVFNIENETKRITDALGCLINVELFGKEIKLCYSDIIQPIMNLLGMGELFDTLTKIPGGQTPELTRVCVEGVPLIPANKVTQPPFPTPTRQIIKLDNDNQSYVIAEEGEFKEDCRCKIVRETAPLTKLCTKYTYNQAYTACMNCTTIGNDNIKEKKFYTALGCVSLDVYTFIKEDLFRLLIGIAGMIALFCILYAAIQLQTSQGNAEKIKKAQELFTSCIIGLMFLIFSVFILKLIGVDILRIPGFTK